MRRWFVAVLALALVSAAVVPTFAQGGGASSTGSISGTVSDAQGGVLPGVTVTATSPAQIGQLTVVTNEVSGGGRSWLLKRRRNQYTGAVSYFKDNFAGGSHNFKFGGEYLDESGNTIWAQQYTDSVRHFLSNGVPNG
ncbi:MAG TPA: carboxypeptidase-like regulatory domain-containing protein, partial [Vicinamibacterales bacterium]|nr:carboxypeptidase-like regulatory domain-containing protein [Vicinamibacterales bacterium]